MSVINTLITDRNQSDITEYNQLRALWYVDANNVLQFNGTDVQKNKWLAGMRACYNASDLNRVGEATKYIGDRFINFPTVLLTYIESIGVADDDIYDLPYDPHDVNVSPKRDWTTSDVPTPAQVSRYLSDLANLKSILTLTNPPTIPADLNYLTLAEMNAIESLLLLIDNTMDVLQSGLYDIAQRTSVARVYTNLESCGL